MKIAVTYKDGDVFQHFGHTEQFKVYDIEDKKIISTQIVNTGTSGHVALADLLDSLDVKVLICGGIGGCALSALSGYGILLFAGVQGSADSAVENFLKGTLNQSSDANCSHHSHGEGHSCGHCH